MSRPGWHRLQPTRDWYVPGLTFAFVAVCLGPSLIGQRTLLSVNMLNRYFPWRATGAGEEIGHQVCTGDTIDNIVPGIAYIRDAWSHGHLGNWQDLVAGGGPLGSVPNVGLYTPLSLPYFLLPLWLAPVFVKLLELVVAIGGTYLFLRRFNVGRPAATLAGFVYATSGFMVVWSNWPQTRVAALIPGLFWAVERLVHRRRASDLVLVAAVIGSMLLAGFPAVTAWTIYLAAFYVVVRVVALYRGQVRTALATVGLAGGALLLGGCLSAFQLLPFASQYQNTDLSYREAAGLSGLNISGLLTLVVPDLNGLCVVGGAQQFGGANAVELVAYVGAAALILAIRGTVVGFGRSAQLARGVRSLVVIAAVFIVALVFVSPTLRRITAELPVFSNNPVPRLRSILGFLLAVLAGLGFDWLTRSDRPVDESHRGRTRRRAGEIIVWTVVLVAGVIVLLQTRRQALRDGYWAEVKVRLFMPAVLAAIALLCVAAVALRRWLSSRRAFDVRAVAFVVVPILVVVQATSFFRTFLPGDDRSNFFPETPAHDFLDAHLGHDRYASAGGVLYPATALYYGQRTVTGHQFTATEWQQLLQLVDPAAMQSSTYSVFGSLSQDLVATSPVLDRMSVRYFAHAPYFLMGTFVPFAPADEFVPLPAGESASCTLPPGPLRGVNVNLARPVVASDADRGARVDVTITSGRRTISSGRYLGARAEPGPFPIPIAAEHLTSRGSVSVEISVVGAAGPLVLSGTSGVPVCSPVRPADDGLRLVFADAGTVIYERGRALPRIRWAANSVVVPESEPRLAALQSGLPEDTVVLDAEGAEADGHPAIIDIGRDRGGHIELDVDADGAGFVVVGDAMQSPGWGVTVDGEEAELVHADHAMVAVAVAPGRHRVEFRYRAPGQRIGVAVSATSVLVAIALVVWDRRRRRAPLPGAPTPTAT